jgi:predicted phosphodiesterase
LSTLEEHGDQVTVLDRLSRVERAHTKAKADLAIARKQLNELRADETSLLARLELFEKPPGKPPAWLTPKRPKKSTATVLLMLSDLHLDEVVEPAEIDNANAYNRKIAEQRLQRWTEKVLEMSRDYVAGIAIDGAVVCLGGDLISGDIHEELAETNETTSLGTIVYWAPLLANSLQILADYFGKVHVPCVVGNHGRTTRKPRMKLRVKTNLDWLLCTMIANQLVTDERITWDIPESADCLFEIYDTKILLTHGDQIRGGGAGLGGLFAPLFRFKAKKRVNTEFDLLMLGHFHTLILAPTAGFVCNGSLKGPDEFSRLMNFPDEEPQQAFLVCTPEHGLSIQAPIFVKHPKEKWV